jgi:MYXO-CTERM domain-containing protein
MALMPLSSTAAPSFSFVFPFSVAAMLVAFVTAPAHATVKEPNGAETYPNPVSAQEIGDSGGKVLSLDALFMSRGEVINFLTDAHTTPAVFSPTCSFSGEMVLRGGGCKLDFGWYNAVAGSKTPPPDNEIYTLIPATALPPAFTPSVGDMSMHPTFTADNIRMDPNYKGGLIGFALRKGGGPCTQTHFTEQQLNQRCTDCTPADSWITAVIWKSSKEADSYYIGFEDLPNGTTSATGFSASDGDFNDFVYYVSGVACNGGGAACMTTLPGVCKDGLQECVAGGQLMCKPVIKPSPEVCDGLDNDCNGMTDDKATCERDLICDRGVCVPPCSMTEFPCSFGYTCTANKVCVENACLTKVCPEGQVCKGGQCSGPCDGVTCPKAQVCRVGRCVDPCMGVSCASDRACVGGVCIPSCNCRACDAGKACVKASGVCVDTGCDTKKCAAGELCEGGSCVDACTNAKCPVDQECRMGVCADIPKPDGGAAGTGAPAFDGGAILGSGGTNGYLGAAGTMGGAGGPGGMGGAGGMAGTFGTPDAGTPDEPHMKITPGNGCRCDASGASSSGLAFAFALAGLLATRRRRR